MSSRAHRAAPLSLLIALLALAMLSPPAVATDGQGDQGDLELLDEPTPVETAPHDPEFPTPGNGRPDMPFQPGRGFTVAEANEIMDELFDRFEWALPNDLEDEALAGLLLEIALLEQLDAFADSTPEFEQIHRAYAPWPSVPRENVVAYLLDIDDHLADVKNQVNQQMGPVPPLAQALDELATPQRDRLILGDTGFVAPGPYMQALSLILSEGNTDELIRNDELGAEMVSELGPALFALADPGDLDVLESEDAEVLAGVDALYKRQDPGFPWLLVGLIAGLGALIGTMVTGLFLRRRRRRGSVDSLTQEIFEAHRRLTGALDEAAVNEIGCRAAVSITGAHDAAIFRRTPDGLRRIGDTTLIVTSELGRVMETAQPLLTVIDGDPASPDPASICAVPFVTDGTVGGILAVYGSVDHPFDDEDLRRLELLTPALGGALSSADALGSYEHLAMVDGLTSLGNRRRLDGDLDAALSEAVARDLPIGFAMIDIDHFKQFNDTHGHEAGDIALQAVAHVIAKAVRNDDVVYRYGGEEFSVLLPGATIDEAAGAAERIRAAVESAPIPGEETQPGGLLTVSVGIATLADGDAATLKTRADEALYEAKAQGRNRAMLA
jgi:diguanylate cyclase (GGDEF)-like protein